VAGHAALLLLQVGENAMAFSNSSYFAGIGTVVAAISLGFAGGAMITTKRDNARNAAATLGRSRSSRPGRSGRFC
jgi:hypothetical protein